NVREVINEFLVGPDDVVFRLPGILRMQHSPTLNPIDVIQTAPRVIAMIGDEVDIDGLHLHGSLTDRLVDVGKTYRQWRQRPGRHVEEKNIQALFYLNVWKVDGIDVIELRAPCIWGNPLAEDVLEQVRSVHGRERWEL